MERAGRASQTGADDGLRKAFAIAGVAAVAALASCGGSQSQSPSRSTSSGPPPVRLVGSLRLTTPAFSAGAAIPRAYTCEGRDISIPLRISGVPRGTRELVLVMRDPDAPRGDFVHWALAGIPPSTTSLAAGAVPGLVVPGRNSYGALGYRGPCPPPGRAHHYVLTLSALSAPSGLRPGFSADQLRTPAVAIATLIGTYGHR
jgi:Raf kinase inhibitor-like YbhB/YbcL family protein